MIWTTFLQYVEPFIKANFTRKSITYSNREKHSVNLGILRTFTFPSSSQLLIGHLKAGFGFRQMFVLLV